MIYFIPKNPKCLNGVDRPARLPLCAHCVDKNPYSFALTSMSLSDFPFLGEIKGGSLYISLSSGWFCIKWHLSIRMFFKHGSDG